MRHYLYRSLLLNFTLMLLMWMLAWSQIVSAGTSSIRINDGTGSHQLWIRDHSHAASHSFLGTLSLLVSHLQLMRNLDRLNHALSGRA
jgi:hypothetical protein